MNYRHAYRLRAAPEAVSRFHTRSASLPAITPVLMPMRLRRAPEVLRPGDEIEFSLWLGPLPIRWLARVEEASPAGFLDRQVCGPFAHWAHRHTFLALDAGSTEVLDEVEAGLRCHPLWGPVGLVMWLGLPLVFAYRAWKTRRLLEGVRR